jgi:nucleotide-binding universal stress UspA family protein
MDELRTILVVVSRSSSDGGVLAKALRLAGGGGARIDLFYCDTHSGAVLRQEKETAKAEQAWQDRHTDDLEYLEALIGRFRPSRTPITPQAVCDQPLSEAILRKIRQSQPDLVMKAPSGSHPLRLFTLDSNDWQLARKCPTALMLVHPTPWPAVPRFGALVNVSERAIPRLAAAVVHACEYLSLGCGGTFDVAYCEPGGHSEGADDRAEAFNRLTREYHIPSQRVLSLIGDPDSELPALVAKQRYDVLALGAPTHRTGVVALVGGLSSKLVDAADSDLLLVRMPGRSAGEQLAHHR